MVTQLHDRGELEEADLREHYVTSLASILRAIRFGAASAHGRANLVQFNFFSRMNGFLRDERSGTYKVNCDAMREAISALSERILRLQGDGDYEMVVALMEEMGRIDPVLQGDLERLAAANSTVDIVFEQGVELLGL